MAKKPRPVDQAIAVNIKRARIERGFSQIQFAQKVGISCAVLNQYENGDVTVADEDLWSIAQEFKIPMDQFLPDNSNI